jgi:hypothetical protein
VPRWLFAQDRQVYVYTGSLQPILEPKFGQGIQIFLDEECTLAADIAAEDHSVIPDSTVNTGPDGLMPYFYGPATGETVLWARALGQTKSYRLDTVYAERLGALETTLESNAAMLAGPGAPSNLIGEPGDFWLDETAYVLYGPKTGSGWPSTGTSLQGPPGPQGQQGEPGLPGSAPQAYTHDQMVPSDTWVIVHNLGYMPGGVVVVDSAGTNVEGSVSHDSTSQITITFSAAFSGKAYLS